MSEHAPLVSCIMPTYNRRPFVEHAIRLFRRQDYPSKQLVIVDDGEDKVGDLTIGDPIIRYINLGTRASIGDKRNVAVTEAGGDVIVHWDDDDWYDAARLRYQVTPLLSGAADASALKMSFLYDLATDAIWFVDRELHDAMFYQGIHTGSLAYRKQLWDAVGGFPVMDLGEDVDFIAKLLAQDAALASLPNDALFAGLDQLDIATELPLLEAMYDRFGGARHPPRRAMCIYVRHPANAWQFVCGEHLDPAGWHRVEPNRLLPSDDLADYRAIAAHRPVLQAQQRSPDSGTMIEDQRLL